MASPGWHRADIVAALHKRNTSLAQLARDNDCQPASFRAALSYPRKPTNEIIAKAIGASLHTLWPQWFTSEGVLTAPTRTAATGAKSSQKSKSKLTLAAAVRT